jgi:hypothetical protein
MLDDESNGRTSREGTARGDRMFGLAGARGQGRLRCPDSILATTSRSAARPA